MTVIANDSTPSSLLLLINVICSIDSVHICGDLKAQPQPLIIAAVRQQN